MIFSTPRAAFKGGFRFWELLMKKAFLQKQITAKKNCFCSEHSFSELPRLKCRVKKFSSLKIKINQEEIQMTDENKGYIKETLRRQP